MIRSYNELARKVVKWNKENSTKIELFRTYKDSYKTFGNSKGYKYSLYTENGDLIAQGTIQGIIQDLLLTRYRELLV
jgi:hypothetical protein